MGAFNKNREVLHVLATVQDQMDELEARDKKLGDKIARLHEQRVRVINARINLQRGVSAMALTLKETKET